MARIFGVETTRKDPPEFFPAAGQMYSLYPFLFFVLIHVSQYRRAWQEWFWFRETNQERWREKWTFKIVGLVFSSWVLSCLSSWYMIIHWPLEVITGNNNNQTHARHARIIRQWYVKYWTLGALKITVMRWCDVDSWCVMWTPVNPQFMLGMGTELVQMTKLSFMSLYIASKQWQIPKPYI